MASIKTIDRPETGQMVFDTSSALGARHRPVSQVPKALELEAEIGRLGRLSSMDDNSLRKRVVEEGIYVFCGSSPGFFYYMHRLLQYGHDVEVVVALLAGLLAGPLVAPLAGLLLYLGPWLGEVDLSLGLVKDCVEFDYNRQRQWGQTSAAVKVIPRRLGWHSLA